MLGTYFTIILVMFIILIVGAVIGYQASFDEIGDQLDNTMKKYVDKSLQDDDTPKEDLAITKAWDSVQEDVSITYLIF